MEIRVLRKFLLEQRTLGYLSVDGKPVCVTCEDKVRARGVKVQDKTAIPNGRYEVVINYSNRFKRELPLLIDVPMFTGIRIHSGNTEHNTEGCILVGMEFMAKNAGVSRSRIAFNQLFKMMKAVAKKEKIYITIENEG